MVGRITIQQAKVFTVFAVAFLMAGLCSAFAHLADNNLALMSGGFSVVLIATVIAEARQN